MPLVTTTEMFKKAYAGGYAVGAFNVNDMEMIQAIVEAANELNSPVILQVSAGSPSPCTSTTAQTSTSARHPSTAASLPS